MKALLWALLLALALLPRLRADFTASCPAACDCKWQSGNKAADCSGKALGAVPGRLSVELQNLDLSANPLYEISADAFQLARLSNLKKLVLRSCQLQSVHRRAFATLAIVIELDLSRNSLKALYPGTFNDTEKLRWINLSNNLIEKLDDGLFRNLLYLQKVELSSNRIHKVGLRAFSDLPQIKILRFNENNLTHINLDSVSSLESLSSLDLHDNPWKCDCNLQTFRDWAIKHKLYTPPTVCAEPPQLHNRLWTELESSDFACKPSILEPTRLSYERAVGDNVTLGCKVVGNPPPDVNWVQNARIIEPDPARRHGDLRYSIRQSGYELTRWVNLTITQLRFHDKGDFTCVAKNPGGVEERTVALGVARAPGAGAGGGADASLALGLALGAVLLLALLALLCYCLCRRRGGKRHIKADMHSSNGEALIEGSVIPEMEKSLITTVNPVTKPPRRYDAPPSVTSGATEMSELNRTLLDSDSVFAPNEDENRSLDYPEPAPRRPAGADRERAYPPDLLSFPRGGQASPASSASTAPDSSRLPQAPLSPLRSPPCFRTLPHSRSQSPFACAPAAPARQGYVTIPRRPRVPSWAPEPADLLEPVYDNLGLRTTADGSSALSLHKAGLELSPAMRGRPLPAPPAPAPGSPPAPAPQQPPRPAKVPPRPPPKPRKKSPAEPHGPLFEDEGEDGTEV